jgi:hypothetical protein
MRTEKRSSAPGFSAFMGTSYPKPTPCCRHGAVTSLTFAGECNHAGEASDGLWKHAARQCDFVTAITLACGSNHGRNHLQD